MNREEVLQQAIYLTYGDRQQTSGDFIINHTNIAKIWSVILGINVQAHQVALCMVGLKLARCVQSLEADHFIDGAAYFAGAAECAIPEEI